MAIITN